jgi:RimJ/RimL family protein N-acetyltransferase
MQVRDYISELDSARFGFKIARVNETDNFLDNGFIPSLKEQGVKLIIARIAESKIEAINLLERIGFELKDMQVTYTFDLKRQKIPGQDFAVDIVVRDAVASDVALVESIAESSFENYGHYFADKRLDREQCRQIYKDWARRSVIDMDVADKVLVADQEEQVAGFLSFKVFETENTRHAAGGLGAVSEKFRGMNIFSAILRGGLLWGREIGLDYEEHNVLVANYPVNRALARLGFHQNRSFTTLHFWMND